MDIQKRTLIQSFKDCWNLAKPYWASNEKWRAIALVSVVIILNLLTVYMSVLLNKWNNSFYDSIQQYDKERFFSLLLTFTYYAFTSMFFQVCSYLCQKVLYIRWRKWLNTYYLDKWFYKEAYYKSRFIGNIDNPDQRISQDIGGFINTVLSLTLGFISNVVTLFSFVFILYNLSGALSFTLFNHHIVIDGYMVWVAIIYAFVGTYITFKIGRPIIRLNFIQEAVEATFRFGLMRVREYSENIAFYHGEKQEKQNLQNKFGNVIENFMAIMYRQIKLDIFSSVYGQIAIIFPILVASPRYFAKIIKLGDLMQISSAFGRVQGALSFFMDAYGSLAGLRATMDRLQGFTSITEKAAELPQLEKQEIKQNYLSVENLSIHLPNNGRQLINNLSFAANSGDRLFIKGRSGSGKTTIFRALSGLWPYSTGQIYKASDKTELFVGQQTYIPNVTLREAISYPLTVIPDDVTINNIMEKCSISHLQEYLDQELEWHKILSLGEQQRVSFARVLLNKPDIIYLDEATSAMDEEMEEQLYSLLVEELPNSAILSIGHRSTLAKFHTQEINLNY
ncbi:MAG: ABC transporter ATP-binding protein/permease [Burkholderiales bacterium]|nr:ABC transporter ATP-binding protein/permease [Burkholderiales bacterium]